MKKIVAANVIALCLAATSIAAPPSRIVSLAPNITEILYDLGLGGRIVAVTDYCDYPPAVKEKPRVGGFTNPSLEAVVGARPDLVILTDDGLATGATMQAAVNAVRAQQPAQVVVAVPTAAPDTCDMLAEQVDRIVCLMTPEPFGGVGAWYEDFSQMTDDEVRGILEEAQAQRIGRHG